MKFECLRGSRRIRADRNGNIYIRKGRHSGSLAERESPGFLRFRDFPHVCRAAVPSAPNGGNSLLIFPEIRIKLLGQAEYYAEGGPRTSGGNISNSHLPGLSPNFILGISKPRDATACTGKTTFRWPPFRTGRKGKLLRWIDFRIARAVFRLVFFFQTFLFLCAPRPDWCAWKSIWNLYMPSIHRQ